MSRDSIKGRTDPLFSDRYGHVNRVIQAEQVSEALFNKLWLLLSREFLMHLSVDEITSLWVYALDMSPSDTEFVIRKHGGESRRNLFEKEIKKRSTQGSWWTLFDFIEYCLRVYRNTTLAKPREEFERKVNFFLAKESSAYRLSGGQFRPITDEIELNTIDAALEYDDVARQHLAKAYSCISQKPSPDFENTVKEAISAVEALVKEKTGNNKGTTLSKVIKSEDFLMHPSLKRAIEKLYGWASDEAGVRHGSADKLTVTHGEAKFALVICAGIVNLIREMGQ